jgi:hypothetical protein
MKKIFFALFLLPIITNAQLGLLGGKNIIKTNLTSYALNNYNITYERSILKKMSISVGFRYMPKTTVPLKSTLEKYIDNPDVKINDFQMGNFAITPELRLYLGLGKMKGFYIAPYARYASFDLSVPITYDYLAPGETEKPQAVFTGNFKSFSGGLLIGTQFQLAKKLVLDFWIIGAHYGTSSGTINAVTNKSLGSGPSSPAWNALQQQLDEFKEIGPFKFEGKVTSSNTAQITTTGAWAGIRALGLSLGFRF